MSKQKKGQPRKAKGEEVELIICFPRKTGIIQTKRLSKIEKKKDASLHVKEEEEDEKDSKKYIHKIDFHDYTQTENVIYICVNFIKKPKRIMMVVKDSPRKRVRICLSEK